MVIQILLSYYTQEYLLHYCVDMMQGNLVILTIIVAMVTTGADNILIVAEFILSSVLWPMCWVL